jgi:hypothetical protein
MTAENGGSAFLVVSLAIILLVGVPGLLAEFVIGRRFQRNPAGALFVSLASVFAQLPFGRLLTVTFFGVVTLAALSMSISMLKFQSRASWTNTTSTAGRPRSRSRASSYSRGARQRCRPGVALERPADTSAILPRNARREPARAGGRVGALSRSVQRLFRNVFPARGPQIAQ